MAAFNSLGSLGLGTVGGLGVIGLGAVTGTPAPPPSPQTFFLGMNLSGLETSTKAAPTTAEIAYWIAHGITKFRLLTNWSYWQPTLGGALDSGYTTLVKNSIATIFNAGGAVQMDLHNYGGYSGNVTGQIGGGTVTVAQFAAVWAAIVGTLASQIGEGAIYAFDLMNEWQGMPNPPDIFTAQQAAINSIRAAGYTGNIVYEGNNYTGAWNWTQDPTNLTLAQLVDPLNRLIGNAHSYLDHDNSGSNFGYLHEAQTAGQAPVGVNTGPQIGVERISVFANWCAANNQLGAIGETGWANDAPGPDNPFGTYDSNDWNIAALNEIAYCKSQNMPVFAFSGGINFGPLYPQFLGPSNLLNPSLADFSGAGLQSTQMWLIEQFTGYSGPQPTNYGLSYPQTAQRTTNYFLTPNVPSGPIAVVYNGVLAAPVTITLNDNGIGGTFLPSATVTLQPGNNAISFVTYTPPGSVDVIQINSTNNAGWSDPPPLGLTSSGTLFTNIYGLWLKYPYYVGPAIRLQRASDNAQMDFYFNAAGNLPRADIQSWASGRSISIAAIYDQTPNGLTLTFDSGKMPVLTLVNAAGYPEVTWTAGNIGRLSVVVNGNVTQSIVARINDVNKGGLFLSQDNADNSGAYYPFRFAPSKYYVNNNAFSVTFGETANVFATYGASYSSNTSGGMASYNNGSQIQIEDTTASPLVSHSNSTTLGWFVFFQPAYWAGSWQYLSIYNSFLSSAQQAAAYAADAAYYSTPLPDFLPPVNPTISGTLAGQFIFGTNSVPVFAGVTVLDTNSGSPTDSAAITISGGSGTLTGSGITGTGPYSIASTTAAAMTTILRALLLTSSDPVGTTLTLALAVTSSAGTSASDNNTTATTAVEVAETPFAPPGGTFTPVNFKGVNLSGGENTPSPVYPRQFQFNYYASKGFGMIRAPLNSQNIYTSAFGLLKSADMNTILSFVQWAYNLNMYVVLDVHNYGEIWDSRISAYRIIGADPIGTQLFQDIWTRLATKFVNYPNVIFGLMNEPSRPGVTAAQWAATIPAVCTAIRNTGATQIITIPGISFTGAHSWVSSGNAAAFAGFNGDPGNNFWFEMHEYLDSDFSGTHPVATRTASTDMAAATAWLVTNGFTGYIGEMGWAWDPWYPNPSNQMNYQSGVSPLTTDGITAGNAMLAYMTANTAQWPAWTYWVGGDFPQPPNTNGYAYCLDPLQGGGGFVTPIVDQPQMAGLVANL